MTQIEPAIPLVLGLHGVLIVAISHPPVWPALPFLAFMCLGVAGLLGWRSSSARAVRAAACCLTALGLSVADPALVPAVLQWYYCAVAVYSLVIAHRAAALIGPLAGACYLLQVASGAAAVPWDAALLRAGVLIALGLITRTAGLAYRWAAQSAQDQRRAAETALAMMEQAATHDELTGLPNRALLHQKQQQLLNDGRQVALLLLDLDAFKEVNDTLGHRAGDHLLSSVGERLASLMRRDDVVARLGGDEFALCLADADAGEAEVVAERLRCALNAPFEVDGAIIAVDGSIGIALAPAHAGDSDRLLQVADIAMYAAKRQASGTAVYDPATDCHNADQLSLLAELREAIDGGQLVVEYQPKVVAGTGDVVGMEALVRWQHPSRGRIMPDTFIPLAERSGLIQPLTALVLDTALEQCRLWHDLGLRLPVAVNLSARNLQQPDLPQQVGQALHRHRLTGAALELEITESFLMSDPTRAQELLTELAELGITLSIDDFGTGMSSLSYLKHLPVHVVKIDKSFITGVLHDPRDRHIVSGVIAMTSRMGLDTVAEGVENEATAALLTAFGCTYAQGYHYSRPMPAQEVPGWVRSRRPANASV